MEIFPELQTERLILRKIRSSDIPALIRFCNNEKISDQIINIPYPYTEEDALRRLNFINDGFSNKDRYVFSITLKGVDKLIGEIGLHLDKNNNSAQFGYWVAETFWGKGIASEALSGILKFGFENLGLNKIYGTHYTHNIASAKVMLKNSMIKEAEMKEHYKVASEYRDIIQYRLTRKEYFD